MELNDQNLIWIDLEMTGLDTRNDAILEIATAVTDAQLRDVVRGPAIVIHQPDEVLENMNSWSRKQHKRTGLIDEVRESEESYATATARTLEFLRRYVPADKSPMCGNTICQDRRFLARLMPEVESYFFYRHLDVSTLKELAIRWRPDLRKTIQANQDNKHRAMDDVLESIDELRFYREQLFASSAHDGAPKLGDNGATGA